MTDTTRDELQPVEVRPGFSHATDPELLRDHHDEWSRLRETLGVFATDAAGGSTDTGEGSGRTWYFLRYRDVHDAFRRPADFSNRGAQSPPEFPMVPIDLDPP